jgi:hypothetical protein
MAADLFEVVTAGQVAEQAPVHALVPDPAVSWSKK